MTLTLFAERDDVQDYGNIADLYLAREGILKKKKNYFTKLQRASNLQRSNNKNDYCSTHVHVIVTATVNYHYV